MNTRKFAIGCGITALIVIVGFIVAAVVLFSHLRAPVALQEPAPLLDSATLGFAMVRLQPDNPWVGGLLSKLRRDSFSNDADPNKILPLELIWLAQRNTPEEERQTVLFSLSPGGRFLGWTFDFTLWKIGRAAESGARRVVYADEGITSFPEKSFKGCLFVRDNMVVWASDQQAAERMVDRLIGASTDPNDAAASAPSPVQTLMPDPTGHMFAGAVVNENGALLRSLKLLTARADDLPPEALAKVASAVLVLDTVSATDAAGAMTLRFNPGATQAEMEQTAALLSSRIGEMRYADITVHITPRFEPDTATLDMRVAGLNTIGDTLLHDLNGLEDSLREMQKSGLPPVEKGGPSEAPAPKPPSQ